MAPWTRRRMRDAEGAQIASAGGAVGERAGAGERAEAAASAGADERTGADERAGAAANPLAPGMATSVRDVELREVRKAYDGRAVLDGISLTLVAGEVVCLMAPSGSGKTTLLRVLLGLEAPDSGEIVGTTPGRVAAMFQEDRLCETLTPVENVTLVLPGRARRSEVRALLEEILPASCMDQPSMELSGGMRRRVSLVRAMAFPSDLVVLDEPFTGLDTATRREAIEFVLRHRHGRTLLVATHGEGDAELLGARLVNLAELARG